MGRPERPLDTSSGQIVEFARDLRKLRRLAGNPSYRELARAALFAPSVLSSAASGYRLPTLPVTLAYVAACGADCAAWERRWWDIAATAGAAKKSPDGRAPAQLAVQAERSRGYPRAPSALAHPAQLPISSSTFVGRKRELASASEVIAGAGPVRAPILVSGPVGIGKTALALRLADEFSVAFPDGQLYADLSDRGNQPSHDVIGGFLRALEVPPTCLPDHPTQRISLYRSILARRRLFVLLANATDECQVRPLLGRAPHSQVVVTSRARLLGLDDAHRIELPTLTRAESMELIGLLIGTDRVQAEYEAAGAIAEACADLPLAVNIAGRRIAARPEWAVTYTAGLLSDHERLVDVLSVGDVSLRDRFVSAYQLLPPDARKALHHLEPFGAGWVTAIGLATAMGIAVDSADELLESLVDAGLLTRKCVPGRYQASTLVFAFAASVQRDAAQLAVPMTRGRARRTCSNLPRRNPGRSAPSW